MVHAGVDGFSRMIVFAKCSDNNRAATVLESFLDGVSAFGSPMCVRSDNGGENVDVWRHMLSISTNPSCVITRSSAHNVRVERMWRDMRKSVTINFSSTFAIMENEGVLDPLNDVDIFRLHYVYLPRINRCLQEFQESWNRHSIQCPPKVVCLHTRCLLKVSVLFRVILISLTYLKQIFLTLLMYLILTVLRFLGICLFLVTTSLLSYTVLLIH